MARVYIRCPSCGKNGEIEISPDILKDAQRGLLSVNVASGIVCEHSFLAYVDKSLQVRDYFIADFRIDLPEIPVLEKLKAVVPSEDITDIDLIKMNLSAMTLTYIIRSIFLRQKTVLVFDQEALFKHIMNFFSYLTQDSFETDISIVSSADYKKKKKGYRDAAVFNNYGILRNYKNLINPKKLYVEKSIVSRFFAERDLGYSYILLKNEIFKAYELSKLIGECVRREIKEGRQANLLKIQGEVEGAYGVKIDNVYLAFLVEIVAGYFGVSVPSAVAGLFDFLS